MVPAFDGGKHDFPHTTWVLSVFNCRLVDPYRGKGLPELRGRVRQLKIQATRPIEQICDGRASAQLLRFHRDSIIGVGAGIRRENNIEDTFVLLSCSSKHLRHNSLKLAP